MKAVSLNAGLEYRLCEHRRKGPILCSCCCSFWRRKGQIGGGGQSRGGVGQSRGGGWAESGGGVGGQGARMWRGWWVIRMTVLNILHSKK